MEAANEILKQVIPILMVPINDYLRYIVSCMKYVRNMGLKKMELSDARVSVEQHMTQNTSNHLEVPTEVEGWLKDVGEIMAKAEKVPSDVIGCFNLKIRHRVGRNASNIIQEIDNLMTRHSLIKWDDRPIPLGRVDSTKASTSSPSATEYNDFRSREETFTEALKALGPNHKSHMVALCGMGGVGKTTMMKMLKKVVSEKKMFNYIVEAVIGEKTDPYAIQRAVAEYLGIDLKETTKSARADKLHKWFKNNSGGGKTKFLIILDNVWELVDLNDIGLSPSPNQGVDFKVLLTSRERDVCTKMGAESNAIINVQLLTNEEGQSLFRQFVRDANDVDMDPAFQEIGDSIVSKCQGLPIAIITIANNLKGTTTKQVWEDALARLDHHDIDKVVHEVFIMSYNLQDETKSVLLLCGLFHEDLIHVEELVRYGWGLQLFNKVYTVRQARNRLKTCIERLIHSNLLIGSDDVWCVKIHDLVRAFILDMFSKVEHASIVNHGTMPGWPNNDMKSSSCKRISLTCKGMSEFPRDLNFPNLSILKLSHGDELLRFPEDFYREMENLQVISYEWMTYPLLPSPQCSTNLRVLHLHHLHHCPDFDCSSIGSLLNLEVLSLANSSIKHLPSTIGNLKKLRLLDLTNCVGIRIDKGVLKKLVKLEELYARVFTQVLYAALRFQDVFNAKQSYEFSGLSLTGDDWNEMEECSKHLCELEFQFIQEYSQPNSISFENLQRFKISVGHLKNDSNDEISSNTYENTLRLDTNRGTILGTRLNELFVKTEVLHLSVGDINDLSDIEVKFSHSPRSSSFNNVRVLIVSVCKELRYLFTLGIAKALSKLEHLQVYECDNLEGLIRNNSSAEETITFPKLKFLSLCELPHLLGLSGNLVMFKLPNLKILEIQYCRMVEHIFTFSALENLMQLEELRIEYCHAMKVILKEEHGEQRNANEVVVFPYLKSIELDFLPKLAGFFLGTNEFRWPLLNKVRISDCSQMITFTPGGSTTPKLKYVETSLGKHKHECGLNFHVTTTGNHQTPFPSLHATSSCPVTSEAIPWSFHNLIKLHVIDKYASRKIIPSSELIHVQKLEKIHIRHCHGVEEVFEALEAGTNSSTSGFDESSQTTTTTTLVKLPNLKQVELRELRRLRYIWKSNQWTVFEFPNLTRVHIDDCKSLEHVFTSSMVGSLLQLQELYINDCQLMEEVIVNDSNYVAEGGEMNEIVLPCLKSLTLNSLPNLKGFHLGKEDFSLPLLDTLSIYKCPAIMTFTKGNWATPKLQEIEIGSHSVNVVGEDINSIIKIKQQQLEEDTNK